MLPPPARTPLAVPLLALAAALWVPAPARAAGPLPDRIDYNRDVRPILSDTCFKCHGFDPATRKAKLRLDTLEGATADLGGYRAIVPGKPDESAAVKRLVSHDPEELMPPARSGLKLTDRQVAVVKRWIEQGAEYKPHWSYVPPVRPAPPAVKDAGWVRNPIDAFVLSRLEKEGLKPTAEADRTTLIRRASLDLTGLPPSPAEVDAFLADKSPDAYEKVVDRLLASPHYGERMAQFWLDVARYADSSGYQADWERTMWPWRDWVVASFNKNQPFDQFTVEQLAGDMLPNATTDQRLASGFNRNHRINDEGGIIPEEYAVEYVVDRVEATAAVWLGQTAGCARCHDHKYDPLTQRDFYRLYAYFNNVPEKGQDGRAGYATPFMRVPPPEAKAKAEALQAELDRLAKEAEAETPQNAARLAAWEQALAARGGAEPWLAPRVVAATSDGKVTLNREEGNSLTATGPNPPNAVYEVTLDAANLKRLGAVRLEVLLNYSLLKGVGRGNGNIVLTDVEAELRPPKGKPTPLKFVTAEADYEQAKFPVAGAIDGKKDTGWAVDGDTVREERVARFALAKPVDVPAGSTVVVRLRHESPRHKQYLTGRFRLSVAESPGAPLVSADAATAAALKVPASDRTDEQRRLVSAYFVSVDPAKAELRQKAIAAKQELVALTRTGTAVMVMEELPVRKPTYLLKRGLYDQPDKSQVLEPGLPAALFPPDRKPPKDRLELARWIVSPENPLAARVTVNRFWQQVFGVGLVKTSEDFGFQGEWPANAELLDWLAVDFRDNKWDVKRLMKLIVTSAAYRQGSRVTPELLERDPENRLLARAPRYRLDALAVRDNALAASGLLVRTLGGKPVKPYQPPGLWEELAFANKTSIDRYEQDKGESLYRRTMYTFVKRTVPPPAQAIFDASGRETCIVRTGRTNTPLQALNLLNDVTYVEAARAMAARVMKEGGATPEARLAYAFKLATSRAPDAAEAKLLAASLEKYSAKYRADVESAKKLVAVGESPKAEGVDPAEHAAYTAVCNVILNLDETVTRE
ncbi:MAG TPA: PSD1 and planctomycete cytochrome C domain-containing protein [Humisphaera sp.]